MRAPAATSHSERLSSKYPSNTPAATHARSRAAAAWASAAGSAPGPGPGAAGRRERETEERRPHGTRHGPAVVDERHRHGDHREPQEVVRGAVEGIDRPVRA